MTDLADLTPRQIAVAALVARGMSDKAIGSELGISFNTVRVHIVALSYRLYLDPDRSTRVQIATWYRERVPVRHDMAG